MDIIKSSLVAFIASLFCITLLKPLAIRIGLVDSPNQRKLHENEVPLIGGISMFFGFCFALMFLHMSLRDYRGLLAGSGLLIFIGVLDDFHDISSKLRLLGQLIAALLLVNWSQSYLANLGDIFFNGNFNLGVWALPFTLVMVIGNINAMNMMDGQDGLAGGIALGQAILLLYLSISVHQTIVTPILILLIVLLIVFLAFNARLPWREKASVFMGDSGSTFIGLVLSWAAIEISQAHLSLVHPITVLWIMALPLWDLIRVTVHRLHRGRSPLLAGRDHLHHLLENWGVSAGLSTFFLILLSLGLGVFGLLLTYWHVSESWQFVIFCCLLVSTLFVARASRADEH